MQHKPLKVLLVEDDRGIREVMSLVLILEGFEVTVLSGGHDVFMRVNDDRPDVVLLNALFGDLDSRTIFEALQADPTTGHIPVLTGPFDIRELADNVRRLAA